MDDKIERLERLMGVQIAEYELEDSSDMEFDERTIYMEGVKLQETFEVLVHAVTVVRRKATAGR